MERRQRKRTPNIYGRKNNRFYNRENRFEVLKQSELGQIFKFKFHKQEIKKEVENTYSWMSRNIVTEYKYFPLITEKSERKIGRF